MYREILVPVDNSDHSNWAVDRAVEIARRTQGRITGTHVYAARLHDVRFRQLETGLPARFQTPQEIKRQRKIHDKLIEKGLQLISDSFLDEVEKQCEVAGVTLTRQLLEGINFEEIIREANKGEGRLPSLIGFDPNIADKYDGGATVRSDVKLGDDGKIVAEDEEQDEKLAGTSNRSYDLVVMGAHGIGRQPFSQLGSVTMRSIRGIEKDVMIVRDDRPLEGGKIMVCVDGSAYSYKGMRSALEMAKEYDAKLYVCSSFDVEYHHAVFGNIRYVLSEQASKVFKFEEQEELHNNIIDKGLLRLAKANIKRAEAMAEEYPDVEVETQILIGKPFQAILQWVEEVEPSLLVLARHGAHRIEDTEMGSQADNLTRLAPCSVLLIGTTDVRPEEIPWIEEDGEKGLEWAPEAEVRIMRVPPFALGIARKAVEEYVLEHYGPGSVYATGVGGEGGHSEIPEGFSVRGARRRAVNPDTDSDGDGDAGIGRPNGNGGAATHAAGNGNGASASASGNGASADPRAQNGSGAANGASGAHAANGASADAHAGNGSGRGNGAHATDGAGHTESPSASGSSRAPHAEGAAADPGADFVDLPVVTNERLDEAIQKLLPTHMQLVMGIGTAEELAVAEVKAEEAMKRTVVEGHDADPVPETPMIETKCPYTGHVQTRERTAKDPVVWTHEAYDRLKLVPLIARPLARNTVERFAREHGFWRVTTRVMDENKQAMIEADTFDLDTMLVMFKELQSKQLKAEAEGVDALSPEMRRFIDEAKAAGVTRCPIRDIEKAAEKCPVDLETASPEDAKRAVEEFMRAEEAGETAGDAEDG